MKTLFSLLFIIACTSHFGTNAVFAQKKSKPKEVIIVEFLMPANKYYEKLKIPINGSSGSGSVSECLDWSNREAECAKSYSSIDFSGKTFRISKNTSRVNFNAEIFTNKECKTRKIFTVYRNRKTKFQLKCGVSLIAYYGFEDKGEN